MGLSQRPGLAPHQRRVETVDGRKVRLQVRWRAADNPGGARPRGNARSRRRLTKNSWSPRTGNQALCEVALLAAWAPAGASTATVLRAVSGTSSAPAGGPSTVPGKVAPRPMASSIGSSSAWGTYMNYGITGRAADANFIVESILSGAAPWLQLSSETTLEYAFFGGNSPFANWVGDDPYAW